LTYSYVWKNLFICLEKGNQPDHATQTMNKYQVFKTYHTLFLYVIEQRMCRNKSIRLCPVW